MHIEQNYLKEGKKIFRKKQKEAKPISFWALKHYTATAIKIVY